MRNKTGSGEKNVQNEMESGEKNVQNEVEYSNKGGHEMKKNRNGRYGISRNAGHRVLAGLCAAGMCLLAGCGKEGSGAEEMLEKEELSAGETAGTEEYSGEEAGAKMSYFEETEGGGTGGEALPVKAEWEAPLSCTEKVSDKLSFEAEVISSDAFQSGIFYRTKGHYQEYDADAFMELFFADKTIADRYTYYLSDRSGEEKEGYAYLSEDGCSLCLYPTEAVYFVTAEQDYYFYGFCDIVGNQTMYNADQYSLTKELSFMTRAETEQRVLEVLDGMEVHPGDIVYQAYALDVPALSEESRRVYEWGFQEDEVDFRTEWEADQEAYAFRIWQVCQGLPVWTAEIGPLYIADESWAPVRGIYREDGFVNLTVTDILDFEMENEYDALLSFEEIVNRISEQYADGVEGEGIVIKEMRLCALAFGDGEGGCDLKPVWICTGELEWDGSLVQMTFDAVTGEEIYGN